MRETLTDVQMECLNLLQEEAAEVIQMISKMRRFGPYYRCGSDNELTVDNLLKELIDYQILLDLSMRSGAFVGATLDIELARLSKIRRLDEWSEIPARLLKSI